LAYGAGDTIDMRETFKTFPVTPLSVEDYARRAFDRIP
jgi:hypothetical protein